jgi:hypothetical protein
LEEEMKKLILVAALAFSGVAHADNGSIARQALAFDLVNPVKIANAINWKVGEFQDYNLTIQSLPVGTVHKEATSEEGNGIWITETTDGQMIGSHKTEMLLDRGDGHVIKFKQDGQDQTPPNDKITIEKQEVASVTVPAGTFQTIHITAKDDQAGEVEIWADPRDISLDGVAKTNMTANGLPLSLELTKFGGR